MATLTWNPGSGDNFDATEIQISGGAQFKQQSIWDDLQCYLQMDNDVLDTSDQGNDGTATAITYSSEDLGNVAVFNGTTSKISVPSLLSGATEFTINIRFRPTGNNGTELMIFEYTRDSLYIYISQNRTGTADRLSVLVYDGSLNWLDHSVTTMADWHDITVSSKEGGTTYAWFDGGNVQSVGLPGTFSTVAPTAGYIGSDRNGSGKFFNGKVSQFAAWDVQKDTDGTLASYMWNSGSGIEIFKYVQSSDIYPASPLLTTTCVGFASYAVTEAGTGSSGHQLSPDDGVTKYYWSGAAWVAGASTNSEATVNTNIGDYSVSLTQISPVVTLVGDGYNQFTVSQVLIGYTQNTAPSVYAGLDKPLGGDPAIYHDSSFQPFKDALVSDVDPAPFDIQSADYRVDAGGWISISKGAYPTWQEAIRALVVNASIYSVGAHTFELRATDGIPATSTDSITVTIIYAWSEFIDALHDDPRTLNVPNYMGIVRRF